jgi:prolipoprotein diacylglyceryl transferase
MIFPFAINWDINPVMLDLGFIEIRYYGLCWAVALGLGLWIFSKIFKREEISDKVLDSIFWYAIVATVLGARLGHCYFYEPTYYLSHPFEVLKIWKGGLASHGAAFGLLIGLYLFSRKNRVPYIWTLDRIGIAIAIGGAMIRLGNLFNSEIYGGPTSLPWGFIFVNGNENQTDPCHPTQLYEALAYMLIFGILSLMYFKLDMARKKQGVMFGWFLIMLFGARFIIEFIKNPQVEFEKSMLLDMGQWLSLPFIVGGVWILYKARKNKLPNIFTWVNPVRPKDKSKK